MGVSYNRRFFHGHCPLVTQTQYTGQSIQSRTYCGWEFCKYCKVLRSLNHIQNNVELTSMRKDHKTLDNNSYSFRETRLRKTNKRDECGGSYPSVPKHILFHLLSQPW